MVSVFRVVWFIVLVWLAVAGLYFVALPLSILYLFVYPAYELVILAILVDAYFYAFFGLPTLSIVTLLAVLLADFIKPRLLMYTKDDALIL